MLEHQLPLSIEAPNQTVWNYVGDMANWASNLPGYRSFEVLNEADSLWTLKVGVGALVRTVRVMVHVDLWSEPDRVEFTYHLDQDPVSGNGSYVATPGPDGGTNIVLTIRIDGKGPMAPVWETMAKPILPKLAKGFGDSLKIEIERRAQPAGTAGNIPKLPVAAKPGWFGLLWRRLKALFSSPQSTHSVKTISKNDPL